jgi:hypothetical protein
MSALPSSFFDGINLRGLTDGKLVLFVIIAMLSEVSKFMPLFVNCTT